MSTCRDVCRCLEVSGAGCQVMAADSLHSRHGESGVLEGGGATQAYLEAFFKLNFF